jgi:beta-glucosidase
MVPYWITLNEPWVSAWLGHGVGLHAPGKQDPNAALAATHYLLLGHGLALEGMRRAGGDARIGITLNLSPVRPASAEPADAEAARRVDGNANRLYLDPLFRGAYPEDMLRHYRAVSDFSFVRDGDLGWISQPLDFLGVNFYMRHTVRDEAGGGASRLRTAMRFADLGAETVLADGIETTAIGWPIEPDGLTELLVRLDEEYTKLPIYITESGAAFHDYADPEGVVNDEERVAYLDAHFRAAREATERGVDLRGYFVWSLLDNFEWAEGYSKEFRSPYTTVPTLTVTAVK